jgi:hypothetical protein
MKVSLCEEVMVTVETKVDVDLNAVLIEFSSLFEDAEAGDHANVPVRSVYLPLLDFATKLMARVPNEAIALCRDDQRKEMVTRLQTELQRWNSPE